MKKINKYSQNITVHCIWTIQYLNIWIIYMKLISVLYESIEGLYNVKYYLI